MTDDPRDPVASRPPQPRLSERPGGLARALAEQKPRGPIQPQFGHALRVARQAYPHQRIGQLIYNALREARPASFDLFNVEDEALTMALRDYAALVKPPAVTHVLGDRPPRAK